MIKPVGISDEPLKVREWKEDNLGTPTADSFSLNKQKINMQIWL